MKIAIVHDQLYDFGGAERVILALMQIYPSADLFTSYYNSSTRDPIGKKFQRFHITTSWANRIGIIRRLQRIFKILTPWVWQSFDLSLYDLVISSSGSYIAKGVITKPHTTHICYLHTPPRYLYFYETSFPWKKYFAIKIYNNFTSHALRTFDYISSQRVDEFLTNSVHTKKRILKYYRRNSTVIYPPVDIPTIPSIRIVSTERFYVTTSRLVYPKHIDTLVQMANKYHIILKIIGRGPEEKKLKLLAGNTVEFIGNISDKRRNEIYSRAYGFLFSSLNEEFGICVVEAMGYGVPVIAHASGGVSEIITHGKNGFLYDQLNPESLSEQIRALESLSERQYAQLRLNARIRAEDFSFDNFSKKMVSTVRQIMKKNAHK